jgi:3-hydroxybutyryl-CoA dehydrogenase
MLFDNWKIAVAGAGTMGHSIAQLFAMHGFETALTDQSVEQLERARRMIANNLELLVGMNEISREEMKKAQELLRYDERLDDAVPAADLVVEAVSENPEVKRNLYALLDRMCPETTIFASNTSALNIYDFLTISHPERLIIAHWFNPPHIMPLVEVVAGPKTSPQTIDAVRTLLIRLGKTPAVMNQYVPGFIMNRLAMAIMREASYMVAQGWTSPEDIDAAVVATFGPRYAFEGPMGLSENVGWDVIQSVMDFLVPKLNSSIDPSPFIADLCAQGRLGVKAGRGIRDYSNAEIGQIQNERNRKIIKMIRAVKDL